MRQPDEMRLMNQLWLVAAAALCLGATAFADAWDTVHLRGGRWRTRCSTSRARRCRSNSS